MIDIKIMAHPSRKENVKQILSDLSMSDDIVVWDDRDHGGDAMYTAKKAWTQPIPKDCTHRLVLQDDVEVCDNFLEIVEKVAEKFNNQIVSFFHCESYPDDIRYTTTLHLWGCAIMIPSHLVADCWNYIEHIADRPWCKEPEEVLPHDDTCILAWAIENEIPIVNTIPSLVQHHGDNSLIGITEKRISPDFIKTQSILQWQ